MEVDRKKLDKGNERNEKMFVKIKKDENMEVSAEIINLLIPLNGTQAKEKATNQVMQMQNGDKDKTTLEDLTAVADEQKMSIIKLPLFDGLPLWSVYKVQFEAAAQFNGWNSKEKSS